MTDSIPTIGAASLASGGAAGRVAAAAPESVQAAAAPARPAAPAELQAVAAALNQHAQDLQTSLHFQVDQVTHQVVLTVIDTQNDQVLLQVPSEEALAIAQSLQKLQTQILDKKA